MKMESDDTEWFPSMISACKRKEEQTTGVDHPPPPKKPRLVFTDLQRRTLQAIFKVTLIFILYTYYVCPTKTCLAMHGIHIKKVQCHVKAIVVIVMPNDDPSLPTKTNFSHQKNFSRYKILTEIFKICGSMRIFIFAIVLKTVFSINQNSNMVFTSFCYLGWVIGFIKIY